MLVALKSLNNSKNVTSEFLNEVLINLFSEILNIIFIKFYFLIPIDYIAS